MSRVWHDAPNKEWSRKGRKEEDRLRGLNNADRRATIAEQLDDMQEEEK